MAGNRAPILPAVEGRDVLTADACDQNGRWFDAGTEFRTKRFGFSPGQRAHYQEVIIPSRGGRVHRFLRFVP